MGRRVVKSSNSNVVRVRRECGSGFSMLLVLWRDGLMAVSSG